MNWTPACAGVTKLPVLSVVIGWKSLSNGQGDTIGTAFYTGGAFPGDDVAMGVFSITTRPRIGGSFP
jgi:hypothetical protein